MVPRCQSTVPGAEVPGTVPGAKLPGAKVPKYTVAAFLRGRRIFLYKNAYRKALSECLQESRGPSKACRHHVLWHLWHSGTFKKLPRYLRRIAMLRVDGVVHAPHVGERDASGQDRQHLLQRRLREQGSASRDDDGVVGREIPLRVFEHGEVVGVDQTARGVAGDQIDLPFRKGAYFYYSRTEAGRQISERSMARGAVPKRRP